MVSGSKTPIEWSDWAFDRFHGDKLSLCDIVTAIATHVYEDCARRAEDETEPESDEELTVEELAVAAATPPLEGMRAAVRMTKTCIAAGIRAMAHGEHTEDV